MDASGIYTIRNAVNGKVYVGSALNLTRRWKKHRSELNCGGHHCQKLQRAWAKHGPSAFEFKALLLCAPEHLLMYEQRALDAYDAVRKGYNVSPTAGSRLGSKNTAEHRAKISAANKGRVMTDEWRANIGKTQVGRVPAPFTPERRAAISAGKLASGYRHSAETKALLAEKSRGHKNNVGRVVSQETREKMAAAQLGRKQSPEQVAKRIATQAANRLAKLNKG